MNTFVRVRSDYSSRELRKYAVYPTVLDPMEVGDHLRAVFFDGQPLLGWVGLLRRGTDERFRADEEQKLLAVLGQIKSGLAAADALESRNLEGGVFGVSNGEGVIEHASQCLGHGRSPSTPPPRAPR